MASLKIGDQAPDFTLENQDGEPVRLSDFHGKRHVVLYFYPKDETPGCTAEACGFRDQYEVFQQAGAEVIGVSADSVASHKAFASNRRLPFQLLSDPDKATAKAYGVASSMLGLLPGRETFVIDQQGIIRHRFASQFRIQSHIDDALKILQDLGQPDAAR
ncbi:MAG: peroxiredoxin [Bacteroidetes bacterium]|nr:MAG: peroxiredoxin [Bacteroidota bacterium]